MSSIMKGPFPTTVLVGDWGSYYNTLLRNVVVIINTFWDRGPKDLTVDIHKALGQSQLVSRSNVSHPNLTP